MKAKEMATAIQNLCDDFGVNSSVLADSLIDYTNKLTESYDASGASNSVAYIKPPEELFTINTASITTSYYRPRRLKCVYCDCISSKESGTCEHCGAPLVEYEY